MFNLIIDEFLEEILKLNVGIDVNDKLCCMVFANDLVLITEEKIDVQILLKRCKELFYGKGLIANAGKCASLWVVLVPKKQSMNVFTKAHRNWVDEKIPSITFEDLAKISRYRYSTRWKCETTKGTIGIQLR